MESHATPNGFDMNKIIFGDCRDTMRQLAIDGVRVQMCVTSPPYYGLRDYGHDGQLGLEETPEQYIANMVEVFAYVWDILDDDGTLWVNLGDSYSAGGRGGGKEGGIQAGNKGSTTGKVLGTWKVDGFRPKNLLGIPWRVAIALQEAGWNLRQDIIWHKPNPMPESVTDRCTKAHEYIFLLSKSQKYFYDNEAIKEPAIYAGDDRGSRNDSRRGTEANSMSGKTGEFRNKRSVWTVNTKPYSGAHFAVFPEELIEPCILAGTSQRGHCPKCFARWSRITQRPNPPKVENSELDRFGNGKAGVHRKVGQAYQNWLNENPMQTIGWQPNCNCGIDPVQDVVLDPFMGSGTTAQVAQQLGRKYLGCELNHDYKTLQDQRLAQTSLELV